MVYNRNDKMKAKTGENVMPWKERIVNQMRKEFVERVLQGEKSKSALCREYGISRPTGDKWLMRYLEGETLGDQSRTPHRMPRKVSGETEELILKYRREHPAIGAVKIRTILERQGYTELPCARTVNNILKRNGMISREASLAARPIQRFEKGSPNEMWQADYKGHFTMKNGERCYPLNIIDDCSRYNLCCEAQRGETYEEIKPVMKRIFEEYGLPDSFLCDNGNPWGTPQSTGFSRFEVWLMELGVLTLHGRVAHPQTQGKEESYNRSLTKELLKHTTIADLADAQRQFDEYREFYNHERPHHSLGLATPGEKYTKSSRRYPEKISEWEYPEGCKLHKVTNNGYICCGGRNYFLSEAFRGKTIAIRESHLPGQITLLFRQFRIGRIDVEKRVYTMKRIQLLEGDPRSASR